MNVNKDLTLQEAIQILAQSQQLMATSLNKKEEASFHKLSKCDVKWHGDEKDEIRDDLNRVAKTLIVMRRLMHGCLKWQKSLYISYISPSSTYTGCHHGCL